MLNPNEFYGPKCFSCCVFVIIDELKSMTEFGLRFHRIYPPSPFKAFLTIQRQQCRCLNGGRKPECPDRSHFPTLSAQTRTIKLIPTP